MNCQPPKWADRFLRWYCNPAFLEEIEGDIYELFDRRVAGQTPRMARIKFVWDVFRFFRWSNVKRSNSKHIAMYRFILFANYLKLGMRNIRRDIVSSSINIFGMAIAICFALSIFIFTDIMRSMDSFHSNADRIYMIPNYIEQEGNKNLWGDSPMMLGPALKEDHSSVETFTRVEYRSASVKFRTDVFDELTVFVDQDFFKIFDYDMISGNEDVLLNRSQIAISKRVAVKYFEDEDPIGKELSFKFLNGKIKRFLVGAVLDKAPYNASFEYDFYLPMENFHSIGFENTTGWSFMTDATFIMMKKGESIRSIQDSFDTYLAAQHGSNPEWKVRSFEPIPLTRLSNQSYKIVGSVSDGAHPAGSTALIVISIFLLGMACFNFMNISVVSASRRLKEIALRKVMGSIRKEIVYQFMTENLLKCFFALVVGTLLSYFLLIPWFDVMVPDVEIKFRTYDPMALALFMTGLLLLVGIISGAYPSFYISRFDVITIFKGKEKFGSKNLFSKILLGFQFFLAIMTIVGCFLVTEQNIHLSQKDWGYDPEGTMSIYLMNKEQHELMETELAMHPMVKHHTASDVLIGRMISKVSIEQGDRQIGVRRISASSGYFDTFRLRLKEGRPLSNRAEDIDNNVVVNQKFVSSMGWDKGLEKTFTYDSVLYKVVGVVEDFHYYDFFSAVDPVMIKGLAPNDVHYLTIQTDPKNLAQLEMLARNVWQKIAPNDPFDRVYQEDAFDGFYEENSSNTSILMLVTCITIILACLGLYGLFVI